MCRPVQTQVSVWMKPDALSLSRSLQHLCFMAILQCNVKKIIIHTQLSLNSIWLRSNKRLRRIASKVSERTGLTSNTFWTQVYGFLGLWNVFLSKELYMYKSENWNAVKQRWMYNIKPAWLLSCYCVSALSCSYHGEAVEDGLWLVRNAQWDAHRNGRNVWGIANEAVDGSSSKFNLCNTEHRKCHVYNQE